MAEGTSGGVDARSLVEVLARFGYGGKRLADRAPLQVPEPSRGSERMNEWYDEVYRGRARYGLRVTRRLFRERSALQLVEVFETEQWGRVLAIDGVFMTSEAEEHYYHEMLVHPALVSAPQVANVLVIGGGDGGTVREVLRHPEVARCTMVEIDPLVVEASKRFLPTIGTAWDDPRLDLRIGDGVRFVKEATGPYDVILLDGTDPEGPGEGLFGARFFADVLPLLAPDGVFALQSESPILMPKIFDQTQAVLQRVFPRVHPYFGPAPLYCAGTWSWTIASTRTDPMEIRPARAAHIEQRSKYYNREVHRAAFALPNELRRRLS